MVELKKGVVKMDVNHDKIFKDEGSKTLYK